MADTELIDFSQFELERVINESAIYKTITLQGLYKCQNAVIHLEKTSFDEQATKEALNSEKLNVQRHLINDIYSRYKLTPPASGLNDLKAIVVVPANETVMRKYSRKDAIYFSETPNIYSKFVEPFLVSMLEREASYNQWIYDILEGRSETEQVLYNDPDKSSGFVLVPDLKSSGDKDLHILVICHRRDIRSLRDLNREHLPLLNNILVNGSRIIRETYPEHAGQLRSYVHYHPSFYHFHVHFEFRDASEPRESARDNLLISIIDNINLMSDYYSKATLTFPLAKSSALYEMLDSNHLIQ